MISTACTNKDLYQIGQDYQKSECTNNARTAEEYNTCVNQQHKSYEEYAKEKKEYEKTREPVIEPL